MSELNIYQKLIEVRKSCEYLKKDAKGDRFNFVSSSKTLGTLRAKMDEFGLLLIPSVTSQEVRRHENNQYKETDPIKRQYFTILDMSFTWVNADKPTETVTSAWTGQGLDDAEKGVGKAVTYAEKYFLLKFFNIPTDKDDPDSFQKKNDQVAEAKIKAKAAAGAASLKAGNIEDYVAQGVAVGMKEGGDVAKWWKDNRTKIIDDCGADGATKVHTRVVK